MAKHKAGRSNQNNSTDASIKGKPLEKFHWNIHNLIASTAMVDRHDVTREVGRALDDFGTSFATLSQRGDVRQELDDILLFTVRGAYENPDPEYMGELVALIQHFQRLCSAMDVLIARPIQESRS